MLSSGERRGYCYQTMRDVTKVLATDLSSIILELEIDKRLDFSAHKLQRQLHYNDKNQQFHNQYQQA